MTLNNNNNYQYPNLPVSLIWPEDEKDTPWFMGRLYEQMAFAINSKDNGVFTMAIPGNSVDATTGAVLIPNLNTFGAYILTVSGDGPYVDDTGVQNFWPTEVWAIAKSSPNQSTASISSLADDVGTGIFASTDYIISVQQLPNATGTAYPYYFFIKHDKDGITGSFNINIQGTF